VDETAPPKRILPTERSKDPETGATDAVFSEPFALFEEWFESAAKEEPGDHTAMTLATADSNGVPSARMVLLKGMDESGFVFYTNMESRKGIEIGQNPNAALCFHWQSLQRSIRIEGRIEMVSDAEADTYFASRPREARIGAWASEQSRPVSTRLELEKRVAKFALKFNVKEVPRPPHWSGCQVIPERIEFWRNRPFRLHDRTQYERTESGWRVRKLFP
jgi:pyridoxamine 5'-phosphate oxidase